MHYDGATRWLATSPRQDRRFRLDMKLGSPHFPPHPAFPLEVAPGPPLTLTFLCHHTYRPVPLCTQYQYLKPSTQINIYEHQIYPSTMSTTNNHEAISDARPPVDTQLNTLPGTTTHLTGHNEDGKAIVYQSRPAHWKFFDDKVCSQDLLSALIHAAQPLLPQ